MSRMYVLKDGQPVQEESFLAWAQWYEQSHEERIVAVTEHGQVRISTVFLGLDPHYGDGPPILFETMVFGGPLDGEQMRYHTREEAEAGHEIMVGLACPEAVVENIRQAVMRLREASPEQDGKV